MTRLVVILLMACGFQAVFAQNTLRPRLKIKPQTPALELYADTTRVTALTVRISGYEKCQSSSKESMFLTNMGTDTIKCLSVTLTYLDLDGRQLHSRQQTLTQLLPPGETRYVDFKSWDTQRLWYYLLSQGRHNEYATPYDVSIRIDKVFFKKEDNTENE